MTQQQETKKHSLDANSTTPPTKKKPSASHRAKAPTKPFDDSLPELLELPALKGLTFAPLEEERTHFREFQAKNPGKPYNDARVPKTRAFWKELKEYNQYHSTRRYVQFVICFGAEPYVMLVEDDKGQLLLPGGALTHAEDEHEGVKRVWKEMFHATFVKPTESRDEEGKNKEEKKTAETLDVDAEVKFVDVIGQWYRPDVKEQVYPYPSKYQKPKEHIKVYLCQLIAPKFHAKIPGVFKNIVPLDLYDLYDKSDPQLSSVPNMLSRYSFKAQ